MTESCHLPAVPQASVVQESLSLQPAAAVQGVQPAWAGSSPTPPAAQMSVVQAVPSLQSAAVVHGTQPGMVACAHTPASQLSVVQPLPSWQSAAVAQRWQPGMAESWQLPAVPQAAVVEGSWSLQSAAAVQGV